MSKPGNKGAAVSQSAGGRSSSPRDTPSYHLLCLDISKVFAVALGFTYVAGFLVVNGHSARYALISSELIQARYLSAGVLFVIVTVFPAGAAASQYLLRKQKLAGQPTAKSWLDRTTNWV